jgi:hypothetical protein
MTELSPGAVALKLTSATIRTATAVHAELLAFWTRVELCKSMPERCSASTLRFFSCWQRMCATSSRMGDQSKGWLAAECCSEPHAHWVWKRLSTCQPNQPDAMCRRKSISRKFTTPFRRKLRGAQQHGSCAAEAGCGCTKSGRREHRIPRGALHQRRRRHVWLRRGDHHTRAPAINRGQSRHQLVYVLTNLDRESVALSTVYQYRGEPSASLEAFLAAAGTGLSGCPGGCEPTSGDRNAIVAAVQQQRSPASFISCYAAHITRMTS